MTTLLPLTEELFGNVGVQNVVDFIKEKKSIFGISYNF